MPSGQTDSSLSHKPAAIREAVSDYAGFDYEGLWRGRIHVTEVESAILRGLLEGRDVRRIVEIGTGAGRLTALLGSIASEYVGLDFDPRLLRKAEAVALSACRGPVRPRVALANLYHIPIAPGAVTAIALVRVYHHLSQPAEVLSQFSAALVGGGTVLLTYNPRPSLGTLTNDVWRAIRRSRADGFVSMTFSRSPKVTLSAEPFPTYVAPRSDFVGNLERAGLRLERECGSGLEEYSRAVPVAAFVGLSKLRPPSLLFPMRFALGRKPDAPTGVLPPIDRIFACPRCRDPLSDFSVDGRDPPGCPRCGWAGRRVDGYADFRYVPAAAAVHSAPGVSASPNANAAPPGSTGA